MKKIIMRGSYSSRDLGGRCGISIAGNIINAISEATVVNQVNRHWICIPVRPGLVAKRVKIP
jgi:hypothetical protein